jgi:Family of unknown function (DUF6090)
MLNFFRKIRQQLATKNNVVKYLRYAVGEILLVVIGILIAVQINNWNRERLNTAKAQTYQKFLLRDLEIESKNIHGFKNFEALIKKAGVAGLKEIEHKNLNQVFETIKGLPSRRTFIVPRSTYDDLISTGNIALFVDPDLRDAIINHYQKLEYTREVIEKNNSHFVDRIIFPGLSALEMPELLDPDMLNFYNQNDRDFLKNIKGLYTDYTNTKAEEKIKKRKTANLIHLRLSLATLAESLARRALEDTQKLKTILTNP